MYLVKSSCHPWTEQGYEDYPIAIRPTEFLSAGLTAPFSVVKQDSQDSQVGAIVVSHSLPPSAPLGLLIPDHQRSQMKMNKTSTIFGK